ncbi:hypothetical protein [Mobilicoccus pelagius]|uniref:Uncharacterized protein n=1 Tax=Mobilicoccus pelagius NBRC 104925 TaxID=1089455 RepID=H5US07_9MICO|nr:hypothetical protein [Mobilicoccus pelagius]GAB48515.1 hypothetical protein MOPEL_074_00020 [Mobilicoccus pelagius NBRC 104925]
MSTSLPDPTDPARVESPEEQTPHPVLPVRTERTGRTGSSVPEYLEDTDDLGDTDGLDEDEDQDEDEDDGPSRTAKQWWPYLISALAFLVAPYVIGMALPAATATTAMLVLLPVAAFGTGVLDGAVFRSTWSFPILTGLICWFALKLYSDPGTWIYAVGVFLLCLAGSHLGGRLRGGAEGRPADSGVGKV